MRIQDYLTFFRWKNIVLIILIQVSTKYLFFKNFDLSTILSPINFALLVLATIAITIAGYIINDIKDVSTDLVNAPHRVLVTKKISAKKANQLYVIINSIGLLLAFYLSYIIDKNSFFAIFLIASLLLYSYSNKLKRMFLIGNLAVSFLIFLCVLLVPIFDIVPVTNQFNRSNQVEVFRIIFIIAILAFWINLIREIVKDIEDLEGDQRTGAHTLAVKLGVVKTKNILLILLSLFIIFLLALLYRFYNDIQHLTILIYVSLTCILPSILVFIKLKKAKQKEDFTIISQYLKAIMLLGILTLCIY